MFVDHDAAAFDNLARIAGKNVMTPSERLVLYTKFPSYIQPIIKKLLAVKDARDIYKKVHSVLHSQTISNLLKEQGYVFDGIIGGAGGGRALLFNVIQERDFTVWVAKVYLLEGNEDAIRSEIFSSELIHSGKTCPFIVKYETTFKIIHVTVNYEPAMAFIMPLYSLSLATVLEAYNCMQFPIIRFEALHIFLVDCLERLKVCNIVHCDIKPENIMIDGATGKYVLIDFGSAIFAGNSVREFTPGYSLGASQGNGTPQFDINCCLVTLVRCAIPSFEVNYGLTKAKLRKTVEDFRISPDVYLPIFDFWFKL